MDAGPPPKSIIAFFFLKCQIPDAAIPQRFNIFFVLELSKTCHDLNEIFKTLVIFIIAITPIIAIIIISKFLKCRQQHVAVFHLISNLVVLVIVIILIIISFIIFILTLSKGKKQTA